jgi:hypothetical protein
MNYYDPNFVDPLYAQYSPLNRTFPFNRATMNVNEVRRGKGMTFTKKYTHYPCPMGWQSEGVNECAPIERGKPHFYTDLYINVLKHKLLVPHREFHPAPRGQNVYMGLE